MIGGRRKTQAVNTAAQVEAVGGIAMSGRTYLTLVRKLPCCVAGPDCRGRLDPHHAGVRPGMAMKPPDVTAIPLCRFHHDRWHACMAPLPTTRAERREWADARIAETQLAIFGPTKAPPTGTGARQGADHEAWKGDAASTTTKRLRAIRRYQLGPCERCLKPATDRHHRDGDTGNNIPSNVELLCRRCHMIVDGRLEAFKARKRPAAAPPKKCVICPRFATATRMWAGRCHRCHEYWRRHGADRPWGDNNATTAGEINGRAKLTAEQVAEIRASTDSGPALARRFGVGRSTIHDIRKGRLWKHIA